MVLRKVEGGGKFLEGIFILVEFEKVFERKKFRGGRRSFF